jgi:hypothetical protein
MQPTSPPQEAMHDPQLRRHQQDWGVTTAFCDFCARPTKLSNFFSVLSAENPGKVMTILLLKGWK